jgi:predicted amidohydrolase
VNQGILLSAFAVAGLQLDLKNGDNLSKVLFEIETIKRRFPWVDMVLLSELATFGADLAQALPAGNEAETAFQNIAKQLNIWLLPGSLYERRNGSIYNSVPVINNHGEVIARYDKLYPFLPYETDVSAGSNFVVFDVPDAGRFGVSICYDKWFPETTRAMVHLGAEVILHPTLTTTVDRDVELAITRASAATNQVYFFDINTAAPFGFGRSMVAGPGGEIIHQSGTHQEVFPIEIDFSYLRRVRERGWQGLGQPLKSYRDSEVSFPQETGAESSQLTALGALTIPKGTL